MGGERQRIDSVYADREQLSDRYSLANRGNRYNHEQMLTCIRQLLADADINVASTNWLDLGSGEMGLFDDLADLGFDRSRSVASDILLWRLKKGRNVGRTHHAITASACQLPFSDNSFDLVSQFTMMTSILDPILKKEIAGDIIRVLKPGGYLLWYDFQVNNPGNQSTRAIGRKELQTLFGSLEMNIKKTTLLPPLARKIGPVSDRLLKFLNIFPMLRTHYLALIGPKL